MRYLLSLFLALALLFVAGIAIRHPEVISKHLPTRAPRIVNMVGRGGNTAEGQGPIHQWVMFGSIFNGKGNGVAWTGHHSIVLSCTNPEFTNDNELVFSTIANPSFVYRTKITDDEFKVIRDVLVRCTREAYSAVDYSAADQHGHTASVAGYIYEESEHRKGEVSK